MIYPYEERNQYLRKPQKIFLQNSTLLYAMQEFIGEPMDKGGLRELYFLQTMRDAQQKIYYSKQADYQSRDFTFEVGGKNKGSKQISSLGTAAFLVKDDILVAGKQAIPLLFFGFIY